MATSKKVAAKKAAPAKTAAVAAPEAAAPVFKPKKSVALSGVTAGNTALCTVGRSGNDLNYRGYDILDLADVSEFEEVAHLLIHGKLPNKAELAAYKAKLKALRGLPAQLQTVLESLPAASHPMDVMRTAASALGCMLPEKEHAISLTV
jgi:2-methylcitrate synthase